MLKTILLNTTTRRIGSIIETIDSMYTVGQTYDGMLAVTSDGLPNVSDEELVSLWYYTTTDTWLENTASPGIFYLWNYNLATDTYSWVLTNPSPVLSITTTIGFKQVNLSWTITDTNYPDIFYLVDISTDNFTSTLVADKYLSYIDENTTTTARTYYLRPYWLNDIGTVVYGTIYNTGSVTPSSIQNIDVATGAISGTKLASGTVNTQLSGTGVNVLNSRYTTFEELTLPYFSTQPNGTISQDATAKYFGTKSLKAVTTGAGGYWSSSVTTNNITPNKKWILSFYVYSATSIAAPIWGSAGVYAGIETLSSYYGTGYYDGTATSTTLTIPAGIWTRVYGVLDLTADSNTTCNLRLDSHATGTTVWFDGIMLEAQVGDLKTPSVYHEPPNFLTTYLGALDATKNTVFRQTTAPTGGTYTVGDLWFDTDAVPALMYNWSGSAWVVVANNVTNTNQVTDGAGLATTALWTGVTGTGKAADNATVGANLLSTYTLPVGTTPASLTLTTGTSAATYTAGSGTLTKTGTLLGWNASGYSTNGFTGGAQVSFTTVAPSTGSYMVGLNSDPATNAVYSTLDYAIYIAGLTQYIYESNVQITRPGATNAYVAGDRFSVIYNGANLVNYYKNGILFYSTYVKTPITVALYMDSSFYETGISCTNLKFNGYSAPVLLSGNNVVGVIHAGNAGDHLSDNIISTTTVQPNSISEFQSSVFTMDTYLGVIPVVDYLKVTLYCGTVTVTGDKFSEVLILMGLSNLSKTLTSFPVPVSLSVQSQSNIHSMYNPPGVLGAFYAQAATPACTATNYLNYQQWYKVSAAGGIADINYPVGQVYTPSATRQLNVIPTTAGVNITTDVFTCTIYPVWATSIYTGMQVIYYNDTAGANIAPLVYGTYYYVIRVSATTFKLATTAANATAGVAINITAVSTGAVAHTFLGGFSWLLEQPGSNFFVSRHNVIANSEIKSMTVQDIADLGDRTQDTFHMYAEFLFDNVTSASAFDNISCSATLSVIVGKR